MSTRGRFTPVHAPYVEVSLVVATKEVWRRRAEEAIQALLNREGAATQPEMEAKISDPLAPVGGSWRADRPQPHHLTTARLRLLDAGIIESPREATRGGRVVRTYSLASYPSKAAERAAARKRLLHSRFLSWSESEPGTGLAPVPAALERVVNASLIAAAASGYRPVREGGGEVSSLLGAPVPSGAIDNAAWFSGLDPRGFPLKQVLTLIEVKNVRQWIYPNTQELYQLLDKAARLQLIHRGVDIAPVLVCRQVHFLTASMARQMGFHVIGTWRQYVRAVSPVVGSGPDALRLFSEVNDELGYNLMLHDREVQPMVDQFSRVLPSRIQYVAERWSSVMGHPDIPVLLRRLRDDSTMGFDRHAVLGELGTAVAEVTGETPRWSPTVGEDEPEPDFDPADDYDAMDFHERDD